MILLGVIIYVFSIIFTDAATGYFAAGGLELLRPRVFSQSGGLSLCIKGAPVTAGL